MKSEEYKDYNRWIGPDCKVWEKRYWGWKFIGVAKSQHALHIMDIPSSDCDHPYHIFFEE